ncbi:GIY-YIG nuclease family protein [Stygiobacter electus]|uniref:GIY-YIG nuclease family protein n=1 Tax=Stygiobacter electus TaxID=3032292 RepID=A0AAE3P0J1_9BACT|nr:GIY-YIG nuclease family protein [Stygiobacter electus]MDF1612162.1 GIY-YIG nuclease family protein [Stygiobacter electus]MDF1612163.1 GIY-YIG nuclease family protein [Stygiobacter electus]
MYYVYIISSTIRNYTYIGITNSLERRINQHNSGYNKTTKPYRPFKLIYFEELKDRKEARVREKYFKSGVGREKIKLLKLRAGLSTDR